MAAMEVARGDAGAVERRRLITVGDRLASHLGPPKRHSNEGARQASRVWARSREHQTRHPITQIPQIQTQNPCKQPFPRRAATCLATDYVQPVAQRHPGARGSSKILRTRNKGPVARFAAGPPCAPDLSDGAIALRESLAWTTQRRAMRQMKEMERTDGARLKPRFSLREKGGDAPSWVGPCHALATCVSRCTMTDHGQSSFAWLAGTGEQGSETTAAVPPKKHGEVVTSPARDHSRDEKLRTPGWTQDAPRGDQSEQSQHWSPVPEGLHEDLHLSGRASRPERPAGPCWAGRAMPSRYLPAVIPSQVRRPLAQLGHQRGLPWLTPPAIVAKQAKIPVHLNYWVLDYAEIYRLPRGSTPSVCPAAASREPCLWRTQRRGMKRRAGFRDGPKLLSWQGRNASAPAVLQRPAEERRGRCATCTRLSHTASALGTSLLHIASQHHAFTVPAPGRRQGTIPGSLSIDQGTRPPVDGTSVRAIGQLALGVGVFRQLGFPGLPGSRGMDEPIGDVPENPRR
ncbi:hypothetical protein PCL_09325 [Purpureocillium lilacinum]|uniref:Uncharacterized protein n=1 Tax=Purpureocillium lilacinum TaxID=33203 RepID=A0A2U3EHQ4_PURLI|nr:hypothetical protein PCL_09325 [Purpureocillium lilacinum]